MRTGCEGRRRQVLGVLLGHLPRRPEVGGMGKPGKGTPWVNEAWVTCLRRVVGTAVTGRASAALSDGRSPRRGFLAAWSAYVSPAAAAAQLYAQGSLHTPPSTRRSVLSLVPFCR